jgi:cyclophilin family peptidyl-prolyl cis-trans isomerase
MNKSLLAGGGIAILLVLTYLYLNFTKVDYPEGSTTDSYSTSTQATTSSNIQTTKTTNEPKSMHTITLNTNMGVIKFETYDEDAPKTVQNFITLANKGFYNNVVFHRVIKGFMIQGGDPTGTGMGGPGYTFADELNPGSPSYQAGYKKGVVAMANAGPNTNGSQFFIMHQDYPLPNAYTIFGKVIEGQEVVDAIATVKTGANDKPISPVVIQTATVEEVK